MLAINSISRMLATTLLACIFPFNSAIAQLSSCNDVFVVDLIAGQHRNVGDISVCNDSNNLYVQYATVDGWTMTETHLAVDIQLDLIPQTRSGNPKVGRFPYQRTYIPGMEEDTFVINLAAAGFKEGDKLIIAAHAVVQLKDDQDNLIQQETGWGEGEDFPGRSWATYISYTLRPADPNDGDDSGGAKGI